MSSFAVNFLHASELFHRFAAATDISVTVTLKGDSAVFEVPGYDFLDDTFLITVTESDTVSVVNTWTDAELTAAEIAAGDDGKRVEHDTCPLVDLGEDLVGLAESHVVRARVMFPDA